MPDVHGTVLLRLMLRCSSVTLAPTSKRPSKGLVAYQERGDLDTIHPPFIVQSVSREYIFFSLNIRFHSQKYLMDCDCLVSFYRQEEKCRQGHLCLLNWFSALRTHLHLQIYWRKVVSQFSIPCLLGDCLQYTSLLKKHSHSSISHSINKLLVYHD